MRSISIWPTLGQGHRHPVRVGAVSGTVLSFELGLLWPRFMEFAGPIIGMPFSLEGSRSSPKRFSSASTYTVGTASRRGRISGPAWPVAVSGVASGIFVVIANAWMNAPTGFELVNGQAVNVDPIAAMANAARVANPAYDARGVRGNRVRGRGHPRVSAPQGSGQRVSSPGTRDRADRGAPAAVLQPISGDISARHIAAQQPVKLAAAEAVFRTQAGAPLSLGGWPDVAARENRFAVEFPTRCRCSRSTIRTPSCRASTRYRNRNGPTSRLYTSRSR